MPELERRCAAVGARAIYLDITKEKLDETFDLVFSTQFLLHVQPERLDAALANMRQMMVWRMAACTWRGDLIDIQTLSLIHI